MGTSVSEVIDLFLARINDYKITTIFQVSGSMVMTQYTEPWILDAIDEFSGICTQDLTFTTTSGSAEGYFTEILTTENKNILSRLMVRSWMSKAVQNLLAISNVITDRDFKLFSASQNLKAKQDYLNNVREEVAQILVDYAYKNNDWTNWKNQQFDL